MATVGETTSSITSPNGSVTPVDSSCSRVSISGSNLANRSWALLSDGGSPAAWRRAVVDMALPLELANGIDQLADGFDLGLLVHGDDDVELVLDVGDEVEHGQAVPLQVLGEPGLVADLDPLLVERLDQGLHPGVSVGSVGHGRVLELSAGLSNRMGRKEGDAAILGTTAKLARLT